MGGTAVVDFDLTIEVVDNGVYRAVVTAAPVGPGAATTFRLPSELVPPDESVLADATLSGPASELLLVLSSNGSGFGCMTRPPTCPGS